MTRIPILTLLLCSLAGGLMLLPPVAHNALYFNHDALYNGRFLGLITGHWMHADLPHMVWNVSALAILGAMIEARSRTLLLWSILVGMLSVDLLLLSPFSELQRYCGLSGLLNTLLGVVLCLLWRETRSAMVTLTALLCMGKIALEMHSGQSIFTDITWPPYAIAHLAGILGTPLAVMTGAGVRRWSSQLHNNKGFPDGVFQNKTPLKP
jgi:rhomboid family GlyGly-CTERM serine protease